MTFTVGETPLHTLAIFDALNEPFIASALIVYRSIYQRLEILQNRFVASVPASVR